MEFHYGRKIAKTKVGGGAAPNPAPGGGSVGFDNGGSGVKPLSTPGAATPATVNGVPNQPFVGYVGKSTLPYTGPAGGVPANPNAPPPATAAIALCRDATRGCSSADLTAVDGLNGGIVAVNGAKEDLF